MGPCIRKNKTMRKMEELLKEYEWRKFEGIEFNFSAKKRGGVILLTQTFNQVIKSILNIEITTDNTVNLENSVLSRD